MSYKVLNIHEIKNSFSFYAKKVMKGGSYLIAIRNKPFAKLIPYQAPGHRAITFGVLKGAFTVPADFNTPLPEFEKDFYGRS